MLLPWEVIYVVIIISIIKIIPHCVQIVTRSCSYCSVSYCSVSHFTKKSQSQSPQRGTQDPWAPIWIHHTILLVCYLIYQIESDKTEAVTLYARSLDTQYISFKRNMPGRDLSLLSKINHLITVNAIKFTHCSFIFASFARSSIN